MTTTTSTQQRAPKGLPTGGQWVAGSRTESDVTLMPFAGPTEADEYETVFQAAHAGSDESTATQYGHPLSSVIASSSNLSEVRNVSQSVRASRKLATERLAVALPNTTVIAHGTSTMYRSWVSYHDPKTNRRQDAVVEIAPYSVRVGTGERERDLFLDRSTGEWKQSAVTVPAPTSDLKRAVDGAVATVTSHPQYQVIETCATVETWLDLAAEAYREGRRADAARYQVRAASALEEFHASQPR